LLALHSRLQGRANAVVARGYRTASPADMPILVLPGLGGSGPDHWQSLWQLESRIIRVEQASWDEPTLDAWMSELVESVTACSAPPVLLCHSLGCHLGANYLKTTNNAVAGALMVAPPDLESLNMEILSSFLPMVREPLGVPSTVVMSTSDPYASVDAMAALAEGWGSALVTATEASGHINVDSGQGEWEEGRRILDELVDRIKQAKE